MVLTCTADFEHECRKPPFRTASPGVVVRYSSSVRLPRALGLLDRVLENRLVLLHKTEVPDVPLAMTEFQGRLLVGVGKNLRVRKKHRGRY